MPFETSTFRRDNAVKEKMLWLHPFSSLNAFTLPHDDDRRVLIHSNKTNEQALDVTFAEEDNAKLFIALLKKCLPDSAKGVENASRMRRVCPKTCLRCARRDVCFLSYLLAL